MDSFNTIIGARTAIDASTKLINFFAAKTKWDDEVRQFLSDDIFALDPDVQPANTEVDPRDPNVNVMHFPQAVSNTQKKDEKFLFNGRFDSRDANEKLDLLENGLADTANTAHDSTNTTGYISYARYFGNRSWLSAVVLSVVIIACFFAAAALSMVTGFQPRASK